MGLVLDTSVLIDADRGGKSVREMLDLLPVPKDETVAISVVTLMEFASGVALASTEERKQRRRRFSEDLTAQMPVLQFGSDLALRTGLLNGELRRQGITVGALDLMIGTTAQVLGYSVITRNVRHFRMIPGLEVVEL